MNDPAPLSLRLLNDFQRGFPLVSQPFASIGDRLGLGEDEVIATYRAELERGAVSRIGAVVAPRRVGASTLAALRVPAQRLDSVAAQVSARAEVNHNYEREGDWNLWFVVTARDLATRDRVLAEIRSESGLPLLAMPLREAFHIDLGFDLRGGAKAIACDDRSSPCAFSEIEQRLMAALEPGLPLVARPYAALADAAGITEAMALELIEAWLAEGIVKRFGVVVRHQELGYTANAMCVWDVPDNQVTALGRRLAAEPGVTLCYRRERALPDWPYNLYCMIHGRDRAEVLDRRVRLAAGIGLDALPHAVLFSRRRFKQCGARYAGA